METIVGVAADCRDRGPGVEPRPKYYAHLFQTSARDLEVLMRFDRAKASPGALTAEARRVVHKLDRSLALEEIEMLDRAYDRIVAPRRYSAWLLSLFSAFAVLLAGLGVYGVLSYEVRQRRREIGIRMALGAEPSSILLRMLTRAAIPAVVGVAIGAACVMVLARIAGSVLPVYPGSTLVDAGNLADAGIPLLLAVLAAAAVPAWRAARMHPMEALRSQ